MCGFAGIYNVDDSPIDWSVLRRMTDIQRHRGPNAQGFCAFSLRGERPRVLHEVRPSARVANGFEGGFGFNRLSILDLSDAGNQPMSNAAGDIVMVFNGEIYNAFDFRDELQSLGYVFRGHSDSEVLLYLYEHYGLEEMLRRVNGMFAIAIADLRKRKLVLVRDRLGIKPLYWAECGGSILFASEVKSFLQHPRFDPKLDDSAFGEYMVFRYCAEDRSLLQGVRQVEPGQWVEFSPAQRAGFYWDVPDVRDESPTTFARALEELDANCERSVVRQLVSDVPLGCQLSGGIDSSLVTTYANRHKKSDAQVQTFSIVVDNPRASEEVWIDACADRLRVRSHKFTLGNGDFIGRMHAATWHLDQPMNHPSSVGIYLLAEGAKPHVTVLLSGEGADELFGGYTRFFRARLRPLIRPFVPGLRYLPRLGQKFAHFASESARDDIEWFIKGSAYVTPSHARAVAGREDSALVMDRRRSAFPTTRSFVRNCLKYELKIYLPDLLVRQDKMTMAHSLENRVPLIDHDLVEIVRRLPASYLVGLRPHVRNLQMRNTKIILKRLAARYFPENFVYRRKQGFGMPLAQFFRSKEMQPLLEDEVLPSMKTRGLFDVRVVRGWWERELDDPFSVEALWSCVAFELWARSFLDQRQQPSTSSGRTATATC